MWNSSEVDTVAIQSDRWHVFLHLRGLCWGKSGGHWVQEKLSLLVFSCIENQPCSDTKWVEGPCFMCGLTVHYDLLLMRFCSTTHHIHPCCWHPLSRPLRQCLWHSIMLIGTVFMPVLNSHSAYWMNAQFMIYVVRGTYGSPEVWVRFFHSQCLSAMVGIFCNISKDGKGLTLYDVKCSII